MKQQSPKISSVLTWTNLTCGRAHNCCNTNAFCLFRLIMLTTQEHWTCCDVEHVSSALFPDFRKFHCCRGPMRSQAPERAGSPSPLLSAIVDYFLLVVVMGYQPNLPHTHDAIPLTLRSASPTRSASPCVNTKPSGHRLHIMIPRFPRKYRKIDLMFLTSVEPTKTQKQIKRKPR